MDYKTLVLILVISVAIQRLWHKLFYKKTLKKEEGTVKIDEREFNKLNEKQEEGYYTKICPKCGSLDIKTDFSKPEIWAMGQPAIYKCGNCKYKGNIFPEVKKEEINEFKDNLRIKN